MKPLACAAPGPHPVGLVTRSVPSRGRSVPVDLWFPADPARLAPGAPPAGGETPPDPYGPAHDGASPLPGPFPLIAFSHGNGGVRRQSTFLTTHLASWGFVVAAPDHVGNTLLDAADPSDQERRRRHREAREYRPHDLMVAIEEALGARPALPAVDETRIGALGHSFGGWTALKLARREPRTRAICGLAPASEPFVGRRAFETGELPFEREIPTLLVAGRDDVLVDLETSVCPLFARLREPSALLAVDGLDHFHFCNGVEFLHGVHRARPRERQPRPTRPYEELLSESRAHRLLRGVVTAFFCAALAPAPRPHPLAPLDPAALRALDPALARLDRDAATGRAP